LRNYSFFCGTF